VLIAAADLLQPLQEGAAGALDGEVLAFTEAEALRALETITKRRPTVVALDRLFAATPRGAALINRIKADPALVESEIRVVSVDAEYTRVLPRRKSKGPASSSGATATAAATAAEAPAQSLDQRGTRRATRFKVAGSVDVLVDGNVATLVDVSFVGAQVVTTAVLKPNQRVRMALTDDAGAIRFNASVAWAKFEIPPNSGPRYRAGIEFLDANKSAVEAYCARHKN
jgi:hypothetical protein